MFTSITDFMCMNSTLMTHLRQHFCLQLLGYLGGVHLAVLAAYVCQRHPDASLNALIMNFFRTFAFWPWPTPVRLQEGMFLTAVDTMETRSFMPILLPSSPYEYCHSNITRSTFYRIRAEFLCGYHMTRVCDVFLTRVLFLLYIFLLLLNTIRSHLIIMLCILYLLGVGQP